MYFIWGLVFLNFLFGYVLKDYISSNLYLTICFILITSLIVFFVIAKNYTQFLYIIFFSYLFRVSVLVIDLFYGQDSIVPHSGNDTENFYFTGVNISENLFLLSEPVYGGIYSKVLGIIFWVYGDDRLFVQYLNILMAITAILLMIAIFRKLNIAYKYQLAAVLVMSFFPHSIIFSSILLRESIISLLIVLSMYFFIKWYKDNGYINAILTIIFILSASSLHSAVIGIVVGYVFAFVFYQRKVNKFVFSAQSLFPFIMFTLIVIQMTVFPDSLPIFNKFEQALDSKESVYDIVSGSGRGGSAYLVGLEVNNIFQLIIYAPIKMFYFFASPLPWSIRGFTDLISFSVDAIFYLIGLLIILKNLKLIREQPILTVLVISFTVCWFIFGAGVSNAGTALRHRYKLFYLLVLILIIIKSYRKGRSNL